MTDAAPTSTDNGATEPAGVAFALRALRSRNYRLFFFGQVVSLVGNWLTSVALAWLVYRLTESETLLGVVAFASQIPAFLIAPIAGVWVDRWRLQRLLVVTQALAMVQSFALAYFTFAGTIDVPHILVLAAFQGVVNAFDIPARQSIVVDMVERRADLPNAIALNSSIMNGARLLGPSAAGILIASVGEAWCFLIDAVSYFAVLVALLAMRMPPKPPRARRDPLTELREGFAATLGFPPMRALIVLVALVNLVGAPYATLLPVFARDVLGGGPRTLGALSAAVGAGALAAAVFLASRRSVLGLGKVVGMACGTFGLGLVLFSFSRNLYLSMGLMLVTGCALILQMASSNTLLQTLAEDEVRGRVMSIFTMGFMGTMPVGSLMFGTLAGRIGAPRTVLMGGAVCVVAACAFAWVRPRLRAMAEPVYVRRGILPQVAEGIQATDAAQQTARD